MSNYSSSLDLIYLMYQRYLQEAKDKLKAAQESVDYWEHQVEKIVRQRNCLTKGE